MRSLLSFAAALLLPVSAAATTVSQTYTVLSPLTTGSVSGSFDLSGLVESQASSGNRVEFTGGSLSFSGFSPYQASQEYTYRTNYSSSPYRCGFFSTCTNYRYYYNTLKGDRSSEYARLNYGDSYISDHTYNGYTFSEYTETIHLSAYSTRYNYYDVYDHNRSGGVFGSMALGAEGILDLNDDALLDFSLNMTSGRFTSMSVTLDAEYELSAVPAPAGIAALVSAFGVAFALRPRRREAA